MMIKIKWIGGDMSNLIVLSDTSDGCLYSVEKSSERFRVIAKFKDIIVWSLEFQNVSGNATMSLNLRLRGVCGDFVNAKINVSNSFTALDEVIAQQFIHAFDGFMRSLLESYSKLYEKFTQAGKKRSVYDEYAYLNVISNTRIYFKYTFTVYPGVGAGVELIRDGFPITAYYYLRTEDFKEIEDVLDAMVVSESGSKFSVLGGEGGKK